MPRRPIVPCRVICEFQVMGLHIRFAGGVLRAARVLCPQERRIQCSPRRRAGLSVGGRSSGHRSVRGCVVRPSSQPRTPQLVVARTLAQSRGLALLRCSSIDLQ